MKFLVEVEEIIQWVGWKLATINSWRDTSTDRTNLQRIQQEELQSVQEGRKK